MERWRGWGSPTYRRAWLRPTSPRGGWCACSRIGVSPIRATTFFIRAAASPRRRSALWWMRCVTAPVARNSRLTGFASEHQRRHRNEFEGLDHRLDRGFVLLEVRRFQMRLVGVHIAVDFKHRDVGGVVF